MIKYYTRACNFFYGDQAKTSHQQKNVPFRFAGEANIGFSNIEIFQETKIRLKVNLLK